MRAVTVGRAAGLARKRISASLIISFPLFAIKVYKAEQRKDGKYRWVLEHYFRVTACDKEPSNRMLEEGRKYAEDKGLPFMHHLKNNDPVDLTATELLAMAGMEG